ncbi:lysine exporter LysO family protein [Desulfovibrio desulfuricans]|uniref:Lysine exporter LysO family protein n=1 Tax=Desulfovibrio desulfuricans TaxID=876 RepID=A0A4P7ULJ3_DESDE|nr:lysine exporter LysO family protein [Desulfovibrio desulfuricans]QCC86697.1 lysine exporter LysO family protein [Desulfovibrio desulfuricans]
MKGSLIILFFFCSGAVLSRLGLIPAYLLEHDCTVYALWLLMLLVGISIGSDRRLGEILRTLRPRVLLLPLATTAGTFAGTALASLFLTYSVSECMAVGAGFAYYSLSSIFISQYKGAELGTIALISNIARELATLLLTPLLARYLGPLMPIACGGASTMDTTLPVITRYCGKEWIFVSIVHAMILDFSVPFWVIFFCTL